MSVVMSVVYAVHVGGVKMMATMRENGEMQLTEEECEKLKLPSNTVIPVDSVAEIQKELQDIADDEIRKLARQIGLKPEQEPYPGYFEDIERLGLNEKNMVASSANPAGMYGPDGKVRRVVSIIRDCRRSACVCVVPRE